MKKKNEQTPPPSAHSLAPSFASLSRAFPTKPRRGSLRKLSSAQKKNVFKKKFARMGIPRLGMKKKISSEADFFFK